MPTRNEPLPHADEGPVERPVRPLVERLVNASRGHSEWRVQDKDGSYCIAFDRSDCLNPERDAHAWLNGHRSEYPEHKVSGYEVKKVTVYTQADKLMSEAAAEIQRLVDELAAAKRPLADAAIEMIAREVRPIVETGHPTWEHAVIRAYEHARGIQQSSRAQKMRDAGFKRRPTWRSLPSDE